MSECGIYDLGFERIQPDYLALARLRKHKVTAAGQAQPKQSIPIPTLLLMKKKLIEFGGYPASGSLDLFFDNGVYIVQVGVCRF